MAKLKVKNPDDPASSQTTPERGRDLGRHRCAAQAVPQDPGPRKDDICYATQNRQDAVREMAGLMPCWSWGHGTPPIPKPPARAGRERWGARAYLIDDAPMIEPGWLDGVERIPG